MAVLTSTHNLCFEQKCGKYQSFLSEKKISFFKVKFSIYLNRPVFVMVQSSHGTLWVVNDPKRLQAYNKDYNVRPAKTQINLCIRTADLSLRWVHI